VIRQHAGERHPARITRPKDHRESDASPFGEKHSQTRSPQAQCLQLIQLSAMSLARPQLGHWALLGSLARGYGKCNEASVAICWMMGSGAILDVISLVSLRSSATPARKHKHETATSMDHG
jgi:hypothetical protein